MATRHRSSLIGLAIAVLALAACGDDDPTGPSNSSGPAFDVSITATTLTVQQDCDASTSSPSAAAGDFFIRVELRSVVDGTSSVLGSTDYELVQANDGESKVVGFRADGVFEAAEGARLQAVVSMYEYDAGNVRQFDSTDVMNFEYDRESGCWVYAGDSTCLGGTGGVTSSIMRVRETSGDPCSVDLRWTFDAVER